MPRFVDVARQSRDQHGRKDRKNDQNYDQFHQCKPVLPAHHFLFHKTPPFTHRMGLLYHTALPSRHTYLVHFSVWAQQNAFFLAFLPPVSDADCGTQCPASA